MSVKIPVWRPDMTPDEERDTAYMERNLLALYFADGWYRDPQPTLFEGWTRVLSLDGGRLAFHIPDSFDVGTLPEIRPNWDGHTTCVKWVRVCDKFGIETEE